MRVVGGTSSGIIMDIDAELMNPSNIVLKLGRVVFLMKYQNEVIGTAVTENTIINMGKNFMKVKGFFSPQTPSAREKGKYLLQRHAMGYDEPVSMTGYEGTSEISSVAPSLQKINLDSWLPGLKVNLLKRARFAINLFTTLINKKGKGGMDSYNPFDTTVNDFVS